MFKLLVNNMVQYMRTQNPENLLMFNQISDNIRDDLTSAYEISDPYIEENFKIFHESSSYLDFICKMINVPDPYKGKGTKVEELNRVIRDLEQENKHLGDDCQRFLEEIETFRKDIITREEKIHNLESTQEFLNANSKRFNDQTLDYKSQIQRLMLDKCELEKEILKMSDQSTLQRQLENCQRELDTYKNWTGRENWHSTKRKCEEETEFDMEQCRQDLEKYRNVNQILSEENQTLYSLKTKSEKELENFRQEYDNSLNKIRKMEKELEMYKIIKQNLEGEIDEHIEAGVDMEADYDTKIDKILSKNKFKYEEEAKKCRIELEKCELKVKNLENKLEETTKGENYTQLSKEIEFLKEKKKMKDELRECRKALADCTSRANLLQIELDEHVDVFKKQQQILFESQVREKQIEDEIEEHIEANQDLDEKFQKLEKENAALRWSWSSKILDQIIRERDNCLQENENLKLLLENKSKISDLLFESQMEIDDDISKNEDQNDLTKCEVENLEKKTILISGNSRDDDSQVGNLGQAKETILISGNGEDDNSKVGNLGQAKETILISGNSRNDDSQVGNLGQAKETILISGNGRDDDSRVGNLGQEKKTQNSQDDNSRVGKLGQEKKTLGKTLEKHFEMKIARMTLQHEADLRALNIQREADQKALVECEKRIQDLTKQHQKSLEPLEQFNKSLNEKLQDCKDEILALEKQHAEETDPLNKKVQSLGEELKFCQKQMMDRRELDSLTSQLKECKKQLDELGTKHKKDLLPLRKENVEVSDQLEKCRQDLSEIKKLHKIDLLSLRQSKHKLSLQLTECNSDLTKMEIEHNSVIRTLNKQIQSLKDEMEKRQTNGSEKYRLLDNQLKECQAGLQDQEKKYSRKNQTTSLQTFGRVSSQNKGFDGTT